MQPVMRRRHAVACSSSELRILCRTKPSAARALEQVPAVSALAREQVPAVSALALEQVPAVSALARQQVSRDSAVLAPPGLTSLERGQGRPSGASWYHKHRAMQEACGGCFA